MKLFERVIGLIARTCFFVWNCRRFGSLGWGSYIRRPLLVAHRKALHFGRNVFMRDFVRLEPVVNWNGQASNPVIIIGDNVSFEQCCHITCAGEVTVGKDCVFAAFSCITDIDHNYEDVEVSIFRQGISVKPTAVGDGTFVGMGARIMAGVSIGKHCVIGTNSVVKHSIPDYCVAVGSPARIIRRYDPTQKCWVKVSQV